MLCDACCVLRADGLPIDEEEMSDGLCGQQASVDELREDVDELPVGVGGLLDAVPGARVCCTLFDAAVYMYCMLHGAR